MGQNKTASATPSFDDFQLPDKSPARFPSPRNSGNKFFSSKRNSEQQSEKTVSAAKKGFSRKRKASNRRSSMDDDDASSRIEAIDNDLPDPDAIVAPAINTRSKKFKEITKDKDGATLDEMVVITLPSKQQDVSSKP